MALKIYKDGVMTNINTNLHKPVIFINGTKYKLDKAYTFVNGVKQEIWGEGGVQVDYISSTGVLGGGIPFAIGENWLNCFYNNSIYRLNISNLSNPTLTQNVAWGNVVQNNNYQSTAENSSFNAWNSSSRTGYKININNASGALSVVQTQAFTPTSSSTNYSALLGFTNSKAVNSFATLKSTKPYRTLQIDIYWNNVFKYTADASSTHTYTGLLQKEANNLLIIKSKTNMVYSVSESGITQIGTFSGSSIIDYTEGLTNSWTCKNLVCDNQYMYYASSGVSPMFIGKKSVNDVGTILERYNAPDSNTYLRIIGMVNNNLYCLSLPSTGTPESEVKLILLNKEDFSVVYEKILPNDPFNENGGYPTFWTDSKTVPQISKTGFLAFGCYETSTLALRIARFSDLI